MLQRRSEHARNVARAGLDERLDSQKIRSISSGPLFKLLLDLILPSDLYRSRHLVQRTFNVGNWRGVPSSPKLTADWIADPRDREPDARGL